MRKCAAVVLIFFMLGLNMPLCAQAVDLKEEIARLDIATMPQYADLQDDYLQGQLRERESERQQRDADQKKAYEDSKSVDTGTTSGGYNPSYGADLDGGDMLVIAGITAGVVAGIVVILSFFTNDNVIFNGAQY